MIGLIDDLGEYILTKLALIKVKSEFVNSLEEFDRLEYGDCILRDEEVQYVDRVVTDKVRLVLYKSEGELIALDQKAYLIQNWKRL